MEKYGSKKKNRNSISIISYDNELQIGNKYNEQETYYVYEDTKRYVYSMSIITYTQDTANIIETAKGDKYAECYRDHKLVTAITRLREIKSE